MKDEHFKILSTQTVFKGRIFDVVSEDLVLPNGSHVKREFVTHPGAVVIIPRLNSHSLLLIRQYRHAIRESILEFPAGTLEEGENPIECAKREVVEETGYSASDWADLGEIVPGPGFCNEVQYCFVAGDLKPSSQSLDEDEVIEVVEMSIADIQQEIATGRIKDAKSIAAFARAKFVGLI